MSNTQVHQKALPEKLLELSARNQRVISFKKPHLSIGLKAPKSNLEDELNIDELKRHFDSSQVQSLISLKEQLKKGSNFLPELLARAGEVLGLETSFYAELDQEAKTISIKNAWQQEDSVGEIQHFQNTPIERFGHFSTNYKALLKVEYVVVQTTFFVI